LIYVLALASAAVYGAADFLGGLASRRASTFAFVIVSQLAGLILLAALTPVLPDAQASSRDLAWGMAAGVTGGAGVALLYRALAVGTMAVVAPTTAVCAVAIPVLASIALGERPSLRVLAGIALAIVAIVLVSRSTPSTPGTSGTPGTPGTGVGLALMSGVAIGLFYLSLARTSPDAGMWPLVGARTVSVTLFSGLAVVTRQTVRMERPALRLAVVGGTLDMLANALYLIASRMGSLSVVVTLSSLYPASTVILARLVLGERLNAWQGAGIACALVAVVLIVG